MEKVSSNHYIVILALASLAILILLTGLGGGFIFDDIFNIAENTYLNLPDWTFQNLLVAAFSGEAGPLKRPISYAIFSILKTTFGNEATSFKVLNIIIHLINGFLLFKLLIVISEALKKTITPTNQLWFLLLVFVWLIHPINTSSVLYSVQMMNSLASLFVLCGAVLYVNFRLKKPRATSNYFTALAMAVLFTGLAALSKENGVLLIPLVLLLEYVLIANSKAISRVNTSIILLGAGSLLLGAFYFLYFDTSIIEQAYAYRSYNWQERLITQLKVIAYYAYLIINPASSEFTLYHDYFQVSQSIFESRSTFFSSAVVLTSLVAAIVFTYKRSVAGLGILLFFVFHSVESTIAPLELVFEHRNYLPLTGIIIFVAALIMDKAESLNKKTVTYLLIAISSITALGAVKNNIYWSDNILLLRKFVEEHPNSVRSNYELGLQYFKAYLASDNVLLALESEYFFKAAIQSDEHRLSGYFGLIALYDTLDKEFTDQQSSDFFYKLQSQPIAASTSNFVGRLTWCVINGKCDAKQGFMLKMFDQLESNDKTIKSIAARLAIYKGDYLGLKLNKPEAAIKYYALATDYYPSNLLAHYRLYEMYSALDLKEQAKIMQEYIQSKDLLNKYKFPTNKSKD
ncbi:hypothetical protein [Pleionea mediterranea]|uniref:Tetratricopeptide repeat protein n=1 Tax=Pleionea mediterranea TaxID=523701 RepID=A0A316G3P0_9GAMM|nr:hypothetical protein [Pleionea mediterranea]PWK54400.1 hypothetical protein C8D97_101248 [Pleionea mediterranea]